MQFLPSNIAAALGAKMTGKSKSSARNIAGAVGQQVSRQIAGQMSGQSGKAAGNARATQETFGNMLGNARRVQAEGASRISEVRQQVSQAQSAFTGQVLQRAENTMLAQAAQSLNMGSPRSMASALASSLNIKQPATSEAAPAPRTAGRTNAKPATATRSNREAANNVQTMLAQAAATTPAATADIPTSKEAAPASVATSPAPRATTSTKAAESLVERVTGKNSTPVAQADASADNVQEATQAMLEAESDQEAPRVKMVNPYTRHTTDGVTYTLQEVSFTRQDLQALRATLVQEGVAPAKIAELDTLIEMPDGATLGQVMLKLKGERTPVELEDSEMDAIDTQLRSVDPSGVLGTTFLQAIAADNPRGALQLLDNALNELDASETVELTRSGMLALGKALGMNEANLQELAEAFGGAENASIPAGQFGALLAPAAEKLVSEKANQEKLDAALAKTIKPIIAKARQRMEKENQAHSLQDRKVAQGKAQIDRSVQTKSRKILEATLDASGVAPEAEPVQRHSAAFAQSERVVARPDQHGKDNEQEQQVAASHQAAPQAASQNPQAPVTQATETRQPVQGNASQQPANDANHAANEFAQDNHHNAHQDNGDNNSQNNNGEQSTTWQELLQKVDVQVTRPVAEQAAFATMQAAAAVENPMPQANAQPAPLARHLLSQVENGMLRTLRNGATSLELQLHPQELGTVNIVLTTLNGEVSAKIFADKADTVDMLNHQADVIRATLEEQGVRVEKVEVELRQNDRENSGQFSWQDADSHNSWQEEDARRQTLARMKNLARVRNNTEISEITTLERSVHILGRTAENAASALDLVA